MACKEQHRYNPLFDSLPDEQGGNGRHKSVPEAYDLGYKTGLKDRK